MGISHSTYWANWILVGTIMNFMQCFVLLMLGHICQFELWHNTPDSTLFYIFFVYGECFVWFAFLTSTFVHSLDQANQISYSLILANILVESSFTNSGATLKLFYSEAMMWRPYVKFTVWALECWPTFDFSLAWGLLAIKSSTRFNFNTMNWVEGAMFEPSDYYDEKVFVVKTTHDVIHAPSIAHFMKNIRHNIYILIVLTWYFDHVLSSNRGVSYPLTFPFQKSYW